MSRKFLMIAALAAVALTSTVNIGTAEARWWGHRGWGYYHAWGPVYYGYRWPGYYYAPYYYGPRCYVTRWGTEVCY